MSNWKDYDDNDYFRRRDQELKEKQEYERELRKRQQEAINRVKQRSDETLEQYKARLAKMGYSKSEIVSFINGTHPHLRGKPDA